MTTLTLRGEGETCSTNSLIIIVVVYTTVIKQVVECVLLMDFAFIAGVFENDKYHEEEKKRMRLKNNCNE